MTCSYMGTDPSMPVKSSADMRAADYEAWQSREVRNNIGHSSVAQEMDNELRMLQGVIRGAVLGGLISDWSIVMHAFTAIYAEAPMQIRDVVEIEVGEAVPLSKVMPVYAWHYEDSRHSRSRGVIKSEASHSRQL